MGEQNISGIIKMFIEMLAVLIILAFFFLGYQLQKISAFKQEVGYAIERQGGINANSMKTIKAIEKDYNNYFTVYGYTYDINHDGKVDESDVSLGGKKESGLYENAPVVEPQQYGTKFIYNFSIKIPIPFMAYVNDGDDAVKPIPSHFETKSSGASTSKIRTDTDK